MKKSNRSKSPPPKSPKYHRKVARMFLQWVRRPETQQEHIGPPITELFYRNHILRTFGRPELRREDIPPGENWDVPLTERQRLKIFLRVGGASEEDLAKL